MLQTPAKPNDMYKNVKHSIKNNILIKSVGNYLINEEIHVSYGKNKIENNGKIISHTTDQLLDRRMSDNYDQLFNLVRTFFFSIRKKDLKVFKYSSSL